MVPIAAILGRGEALTVAAMLDAAGIIVHVGGEFYTSYSADIIAIGGFRLTVPHWQFADASALLREMLAEPEPPVGSHMRRAIGRFMLATLGSSSFLALPFVLTMGPNALLAILAYPLMVLTVPVNPQGRADYFLSAAA